MERPNTAYGQSETSVPYGRSFQEDFESQMQQIRERHPEGLFVWKGVFEEDPIPIMTEPTISRVRAPPPPEPIH